MKLNGLQFAGAVDGLRLEDKTRSALFAILVEGRTWSWAASTYGITRSGILRAMRRVKAKREVHRCPHCGSPIQPSA